MKRAKQQKSFVMWHSSPDKYSVFASKCENNWRQSNRNIHLSCDVGDSKTFLSFSLNLDLNRSEPVRILQLPYNVILFYELRTFVSIYENTWGEAGRKIHWWRSFHERANCGSWRQSDKIIEVSQRAPVIFYVTLIFVRTPSFRIKMKE